MRQNPNNASSPNIFSVWWDAAQSAKATQKPELLAGAGYWYSLAAPAMSGLAKARIDKRSAETTAALPRPENPRDESTGRSRRRLLIVDVDADDARSPKPRRRSDPRLR